jgi:hypothetical protein
VLPSRLILFDLTFSLVPGPLLLLASVAFKVSALELIIVVSDDSIRIQAAEFRNLVFLFLWLYLVIARQLLYYLGHTSSPLFCCSYFGDRVLLFCLNWLGQQSTIAVMISTSHHAQLSFHWNGGLTNFFLHHYPGTMIVPISATQIARIIVWVTVFHIKDMLVLD